MWIGWQYIHSINIADRWDHVYRCYKTYLEDKHGFAELCFQCDEWITAGAAWHEHCQRHLDDLETLPVQCNPVIFRRTLAAAGQCFWCLFDPTLPPTIRFRQFRNKRCWIEHHQGHIWQLEEKSNQSQGLCENKAILCPDQRCALFFDSIQNLECQAKMYTVSSGTSSVPSKGVARPINLASMEKPISARMLSSNVNLIPWTIKSFTTISMRPRAHLWTGHATQSFLQNRRNQKEAIQSKTLPSPQSVQHPITPSEAHPQRLPRARKISFR